MDLETSKSFLRCLGTTQFESKRSGWVTCACPLGPWKHQDGSGKGSFGLKVGPSNIFVKCFSCDYHGTPMDLVYEIRTRNKLSPSGKTYELGKALAIVEANPSALLDVAQKSIDEMTYENKPDFLFPEDWLAEFEAAWGEDAIGRMVHPYLESRQMPWEVAKMLDLRWDNVSQRVCFPVRDYKGQLRGLHGRSIHEGVNLKYLMYTVMDPDTPGQKRCNPDVWLGESWVDPELPVVIAESVFDLARVFQCYRNVMSPLRASINEAQMKRLVGVTSIVTMFDADKAGKQAHDKIAARFHDIPVMRAVLPDAYDPSGMQIEEVVAILGQFVDLDAILLAQPSV